jgi:hypothetical protein
MFTLEIPMARITYGVADAYVILFQNSISNPTDKYRVALFSEWAKHIEEGTAYVFVDFDTYEEASEECNRRNAEVIDRG